MQQVPGEVELEDADQPQYFDVEKDSTVAMDFKKTRQRRREFLVLVAGVSCRGCRMDPRILLQ